ncbi:MAG: UDP-N-acetylglucosamine 2-epimerase (non-hydrolyzing) [Kiritimatiellales bacterium]
MKKISVIFGTRPEAIKLAPVILALKAHPDFECHVCVTAQHRQMLDQVLEVFDIRPDVDLDLMKPNQTLAGLTARAITGIDQYLAEYKPDMILVQGDTTTVFSAALAAFYHKIPVGHVEAGLRTGNMMSPWPEEANRVLTSRIAGLHFAPTETSRQNLLREHILEELIIVTGNTVIDALFLALEKIKGNPPHVEGLPDFLQPSTTNNAQLSTKHRMVLITGHRRENFGQGFEDICRAIAELARRFPDVHFVYPVHLNPNVREPVERILCGESVIGNVHLLGPLDYLPFVAMMNRAHIILTDSGGVQEEAPSLGKPVLVMRDTTERPEAVDAGTVRLVGTDYEAIIGGVSELLMDQTVYETMSRAHNPYGDGKATDRHLKALERFFTQR